MCRFKVASFDDPRRWSAGPRLWYSLCEVLHTLQGNKLAQSPSLHLAFLLQLYHRYPSHYPSREHHWSGWSSPARKCNWPSLCYRTAIWRRSWSGVCPGILPGSCWVKACFFWCLRRIIVQNCWAIQCQYQTAVSSVEGCLSRLGLEWNLRALFRP